MGLGFATISDRKLDVTGRALLKGKGAKLESVTEVVIKRVHNTSINSNTGVSQRGRAVPRSWV